MNGRCINYNIEKVWEVEGRGVCMATHPDKPNWSGHSRGRKIHLAKDKKYTICNMLVDGYIPDRDRNWAPVSNGRCKICFNV